LPVSRLPRAACHRPDKCLSQRTSPPRTGRPTCRQNAACVVHPLVSACFLQKQAALFQRLVTNTLRSPLQKMHAATQPSHEHVQTKSDLGLCTWINGSENLAVRKRVGKLAHGPFRDRCPRAAPNPLAHFKESTVLIQWDTRLSFAVPGSWY